MLFRSHSQQTADALVWADMRGHPAHGVVRIPTYVKWIESGQTNAKAKPKAVLGNVEQLKTELAMLALAIKGQPRAEGFDVILLPGERGARAYARRSREGIPVPAKTWQQIGEVATKLGIGLPQKNAA